jgi:hypothetical protein
VATVTSGEPMVPLGEVAMQEVVEEQLTELAPVEPNSTVVEPTTKPVPVMVTIVPPAKGPAEGLTELIVGAAS